LLSPESQQLYRSQGDCKAYREFSPKMLVFVAQTPINSNGRTGVNSQLLLPRIGSPYALDLPLPLRLLHRHHLHGHVAYLGKKAIEDRAAQQNIPARAH